MKLAIVGSRGFNDYELLKQTIYKYFGTDIPSIEEIVSGGAVGADSLGAKFANDYNIKLTEFIPEWKKYGLKAGAIRNEDIIKNADTVLVFWNGISNGTKNALEWARKYKKTTLIVYYQI
jgi:hypothetical protein